MYWLSIKQNADITQQKYITSIIQYNYGIITHNAPVLGINWFIIVVKEEKKGPQYTIYKGHLMKVKICFVPLLTVLKYITYK